MSAPERRRRRWHRAVLPLAVAIGLLLVTVIAHAVEQPDPTDPAFLSPVSDADIGGRELADRIRTAGIHIRRETSAIDALRAVRDSAGATLLVPAPELLHRDTVRLIGMLPAGTRVVLVDARARTLRAGRMPVAAGPRRWATAVRAPTAGPGFCAMPEADRAGGAAVTRQRYGNVPAGYAPHRCYEDGLVMLRWQRVELVLVGASDPFRNDRLDEHGNAALSVGLLTARPDLIWLDRHVPDQPPSSTAREGTPDEDGYPQEPGGEDREGSDPAGDGEDGRNGGSGDESGQDGSASSSGTSLYNELPPWFLAVLAQLALAALVVALWRARRLGPPVAEPLPVLVRSAETVRGRGRLYQRAHARGRALEILRSAARTKLTALLSLHPDATTEEVIAAVAAQSGRPPSEVEDVLYGPVPRDDDELVRMAAELEALTHAVTAPPHGQMEEQQ